MKWNDTPLSKIMLVEDDPVHARIMRRAFESPQSADQIVHLSDGESAMAALFPSSRDMEADAPMPSLATSDPVADTSAGLPSIILLDLRLPVVDGFDVLQAIRSNQRTRNIPVIVVSTSERTGDIRECYKLGANAYITKPVDYTSFLEKLRSLKDFWLKSAELPDDQQ